jgi:hypothetical protein
MSAAGSLFNDLAEIGATIRPAGDRLILRAGRTTIPAALVTRVREAKADLLATLAGGGGRPDSFANEEKRYDFRSPRHRTRDRTLESRIVEWLDQHPAPSPPGRCAWCGGPELLGAVVLPFGTEPGTHAWLHSECWADWHCARRAEATAAIAAMGIDLPLGFTQQE